MSIAVENFVKAIYKNGKRDNNDTKPGNIAKELGISNAAATDMAKKLAVKDLLHYEKYLGNPKFDPHGDPIPNADGEITTIDTSISLSNAEEGKTYIISRLMSDDKEFFDFCGQHGLKYGNTVLVSKQFSKNKMTQILINNNTILLNEDFTSIIYLNTSN